MYQKEQMRMALLLAAQGDVKKAAEMEEYLGKADLSFSGPVSVHITAAPKENELADGIYLVFGNEGMHQLYTPGAVTDDMKTRCTGIGVKLGEKALVLALADMEDPDDSEEKDLTLTTAKSPADYDKAAYKDTYDDAGADWDGQGNTDRLALAGILNPKIAQQLSKGQYVPAMGQLLFVHLFRKQINQALREVGGQEIEDLWYWTSTEYSSTHAWILNRSSGNMSTNTKASNRNRVRAVSAFIF